MAEQKNQDLNQLLKIRRDKLAELQANGKDPFQITKFNQTHHSLEVKNLYEAHEAELLKDRTELEYKTEPLKNVYEGIFTKPFTMFYGETLHYYFSEECNGQTKRTPERVLGMSKVEGTPFSKYQMINQILSARKLDKHHEVKQGLKQYFRQEQYVKEMFVITEED